MGKRTVEQVKQELLEAKAGVFDILEQIGLHTNAIKGYEKKKQEALQLRARLEAELKTLQANKIKK